MPRAERADESKLEGGELEGGEAGFTLLEIVCALAIVALLAAIALPRLPLGTSRPRLEAYAVEAAAVFKADRAAAIRRGALIATGVDALTGRVVSGASGRTIRIPRDVRVEAVLPRYCNGRRVNAAIGFFPSGMSCGGVLTLARGAAAYEVRVNWLTGGVEIVSRHNS
ncbi:prepilin-type N-terminal cleavage/methylation domain-containing protein [Xanthobacter sp. KR7-65]|uniref:prepilin-type N-terminal cleavage/methylation domain-containing protein n=1 Tax=Xanthobacter sp. KR7-65 TaxID=3156612 RepID=UPI0032B581C7